MEHTINFSGYQKYIDKILQNNNNIAVSTLKMYEIFWYVFYNCVIIPKYRKVMVYFENLHELLNSSEFIKMYLEQHNINFSLYDGNIIEFYIPENETYFYIRERKTHKSLACVM